MKRYLPKLAVFFAAICLISAPFVGALSEETETGGNESPVVIADRSRADAVTSAADPSCEIAAASLDLPTPDQGEALPSGSDSGALPDEDTGSQPAGTVLPSPKEAAWISARSAIVMDGEAGAVLYEKDPDRRSLIASTTKIMTGYLACRLLDPEAVYTVPDAAVGIEGSSMYLQQGEELTARDLLLGLMLHSGNDAATALAILCDGDEAAFVERMNREAEALGLGHTHFANPHGLDSEENYSSARDLAVLTAAALREPLFAELVSTRQTQAAGRTLTNHNKLLWSYEGCVGVKTGYTKAAGRILVSAARRGGRLLVCVTLDDPNDWSDHRRLLDDAFSQYHEIPVAITGEELLRLRQRPGDGQPLMALEDFSVLLLPGEELSYRFSPLPEDSAADLAPAPPFAPGDAAGRVEICVDGRPAGAVRVSWGEGE